MSVKPPPIKKTRDGTPPAIKKATTPGARVKTSAPKDDVQLKQMEDTVRSLREELEKEKSERNFFQLERDKINAFWEISKEDLENCRAEMRNKDRETEELIERHQVEIKVYKQKVKHLHYEHQNNITQLKTDEEGALKTQNDDHRNKEVAMKKINKKIKMEMKELEESHEDVVRNLKLEHDKAITKLRQEQERITRELHSKFERKMKQLRQELELKRKNELHEIEERKNAHIGELIRKHDLAFTEIKAYYNDITANNLELIKSLKEQLEEMKKKEASDQKLMLEVTMENKRLTEPLHKAQKEVDSLRHELINYNKDKESLANAKASIKKMQEELKQLQWEHEIMVQRFTKVEAERDELYKKFVSSIHQVQQKSDLRNLLLEKKLDTLNGELEMKEAHLTQLLSTVNLDPVTMQSVTSKVDSILEDKNQSIRDLNYELVRARKANSDIIRVYEAKMQEFGIPVDELGFTPHYANSPLMPTTPANLVAQ
ncbi:hypothetical protein PROFUN_03072 [Planoprotostelium fungivorum]|uniref:Growth arrest-specific protein 8 domain-containing protein n=1 Tax=Planoprotostelium fungivorum TaxID=1890364 RepID=A0A2P6NQ63_9EUKA|nr:hypothetical protein PROFUN_03072 [Planoprotostelium fungivorum]